MQRTITPSRTVRRLACVAACLALGTPPAAAAHATGETDYPRPSARERHAGEHVSLRHKRIRTKHRRIAPGLTFTKIVDPRTPRRIFVIRAGVEAFPITYDVTLAGPTLGFRATVLQMAERNGALAAINGDFSSRIVGRPVHAFVEDGTFVRSAGQGGASFVVSHNERRASAGPTEQVMTARDTQNDLTWRIDRWNNGPPGVGEVAAFSPAGGTLETPPDDACYVHLEPDGPARPASEGGGFDQDFTIDRSTCRSDAVGVAGGVVLTAIPGTDEATELSSLTLGTGVLVHLSLGWAGTYDVLGGDTTLVDRGHVSVARMCGSYYCQAQPRTGIGVQADGKVLMVVVDGRQRRYSLGVSLLAFGRLMKRLGAVEALNLDGGGASTMVVEGRVVNRPSDGSPRHVTTAALILPGPDPGEP